MRGFSTFRNSEARQLLEDAQYDAVGEDRTPQVVRTGRRNHRRVQAAADRALKDSAARAERSGQLDQLRAVLQYDGWLASEKAKEQARAQLRRAVKAAAREEQLFALPGARGWGTGRIESDWSGAYEDMVTRVKAEHRARADAAKQRRRAARQCVEDERRRAFEAEEERLRAMHARCMGDMDVPQKACSDEGDKERGLESESPPPLSPPPTRELQAPSPPPSPPLSCELPSREPPPPTYGDSSLTQLKQLHLRVGGGGASAATAPLAVARAAATHVRLERA